METCVRGFSYMPKEAVSAESLQYIEGEELTRKWRASQRERQKQREQLIWEEFVVKEKDVLSTVCKDDPYQFLEHLPPECLKELMEAQLKKMQKEKEEEEAKIVEAGQLGRGDSPSLPHAVTFADDQDKDEDMFHIFDDKEDEVEKSAGEEEPSDSLSPSTVRELSPDSRALSPDKGSSKSSENVANVIENSIYFAKVKDLRNKMSEELANIVLALERRDVINIDPSDLVKMCRRSAEFSARFNRVHMYQLKRQINDLERNNSVSLPFAKHTQFQAQMVRIASLHQNMLQALQVFHKSIEQTACVRESIDTLRSLLDVCRRGIAHSHQHLAVAGNLSADKVIPSCNGLEEAINEYAAKLSSYMDSTENTHTSHSRKSLKGRKKSSIGTWSKSGHGGGKSVSGTRLSMYSLDTMRLNLKPKSSKEISSGGTSKVRCARSQSRSGPQQSSPRSPKKSGHKRSPRSRRPLMRDPNSGRSKSKRKVTRETEIRTMVETVGTITCTSSRVSCIISPLPPLKSPKRRSKDNTPRSIKNTPRKPPLTPRKVTPSPQRKSTSPQRNSTSPQRKSTSPQRKSTSPSKFKRRGTSPPMKEGSMKAALTTISNEIPEASSAIRPILMSAKSEKRTEVQKKVPHGKQAEMSDTPRSTANPADTPRSPTPRSVSETPRTATETSHPTSHPMTASPRVVTDAGRTPDTPRSVSHSARRGEMMTSEKRCEIAARERSKTSSLSARCEVTRIVRQLCGGDTAGSRNERVSGAKNAQLLCVSGSSPRQPSTPQLLRILEETIQKKVPKQLFNQPTHRDRDRFRMTFNIPEVTADKLFQYRTKFVQHMLTSPMYANSLLGKPWEVISSISNQIIDDLLAMCAKEIQLEDKLQRFYEAETR